MPIEIQNLSTTQQRGWIPLALGDGRVWDSTNNMGALLSTATAPKFDVISTAAVSSVSIPTINWSTGSVTPVMWPGVALPPDYSTVDGVTLHIITSKSSNNDTACTFGVDFITNAAASSVTSSKLDFTASADLLVQLSSANSPAVGNALAVRITPGTHATDQVRIHGLALEYGRKRRG